MTNQAETILALEIENKRLRDAIENIMAISKCYIPGGQLTGARKEIFDISAEVLSKPTPTTGLLDFLHACVVQAVEGMNEDDVKATYEALPPEVKDSLERS